jgi:hypothetical protein
MTAPYRRWFQFCRIFSSSGRQLRADENRQSLIRVLREAQCLIDRPGNDFSWSYWRNADEARADIDHLVAILESGQMPPRQNIEVLCVVTGPICEVSVSSGWGPEYLALSETMDKTVDLAYRD